ncbi:MAG: 16S rRNA (adenine(1518)-N(6)/adenine(1519)-N(6))-dimethyltransferase RsmA [Bacteroidia bacterium]
MDKVKPKKSLGQHFLTDKQLAQKIVRTLTAPENAQVVEIGPGMGILTQYLVEKFPSFRVVEIDSEAVAFLTERFENRLTIIHQDVLAWQPAKDLQPDAYLIGNLPYNISSPIFFHLLENKIYVKEGVFMIQKEVAERICAKAGNKTYGILSVLLGYYYELKYEFSVPPSVFSPPPKVMSAVLSMKRRENVADITFSDFKRVVKAAFNQRRKTLRNALKGLAINDFEGKEKLLDLRAEQLQIADFIHITQHLLIEKNTL